ncbi:MAG TPA: DUF3824 domain-containing protein [Candidatus Eisenbacteria bacterium]|nr:DUF3824 domain-containing protein [Candidatus Eisenbacteria bacterium]
MPAGRSLLRIVAVAFALAAALALVASVSVHAAPPPIPPPCLPNLTCLPPPTFKPPILPTPRPPGPPAPSPQPTAAPTPAPSPTTAPGPGPAPLPVPGLGQDMGLGAVVKFAASGAQWTSSHMTDWLHRPQSGGNWFIPIYQRMMTVGAVLLLPFLLLAIFDAVRFRDLGMLVKAVAIWLPLAVLLTMVAVGIAQAGMAVTDELTDYVLATPGVNMSGFFGKLAALFGELLALAGTFALDGFAPGAAVAFGAAMAVLGAGVGIFVELIIRQAAIYASLLFLPLAFAGTVWPSARGWARLLVRLLFVAIVSKFVVASVLVLGVAAFDGATVSSTGSLGDSGIESMLVGAALVVVAFSSPLVLLRFLPMVEGAFMGWGRHARRTVSSVSTGGGSRLFGLVRTGARGGRVPAARPPRRVAAGGQAATAQATRRAAPGRPSTPAPGNPAPRPQRQPASPGADWVVEPGGLPRRPQQQTPPPYHPADRSSRGRQTR